MIIYDEMVYRQHLAKRIENKKIWNAEIILTILLFGSVGAIAWAIRGTSGWGGVDGTVVPGLTWGLLWFYFCHKKGINASGIVFWLGLSLALGGELGYGQYTSWISGIFYAGDSTYGISPMTGYLWFFICGVGWAAAGGIVLGWLLGERRSLSIWVFRTIFVIVLLFILFDWALVEGIAAKFTEFSPGLLFPNSDLGLYLSDLDKHLERTIYTNTQNFLVLLWWIAALIFSLITKDKTTFYTGLIIGIGFGIGFMQSAIWCLGYGFAPNYIDWWKIWELNSGFNLGIVYAIVMYWSIYRVDNERKDSKYKSESNFNKHDKIIYNQWSSPLYAAISGSVLLYFMSFEYFFTAGLFLIVFYFLSVLSSIVNRNDGSDEMHVKEKKDGILLTYSIFLLLFLLFHGASSQGGIFLELYTPAEADQYAWPSGRILLFLPFVLILFISAVIMIWRIITGKINITGQQNYTFSEIGIIVITLIGFIGALTIWPAKIGVLYAFFIIIAVFSFFRLNFGIKSGSE